MNRNFVEMLSALSAERAEYLLVGAHAMAAHGVPRATGDIDLWVRPSAENAQRVWRALVAFRAPLAGTRAEDFAVPDLVYQMGVPPYRIDILTSIDGVEFEGAWSRRFEHRIDGLLVPVIGREDLIANKRASARPKDLVDVRLLEGPGR